MRLRDANNMRPLSWGTQTEKILNFLCVGGWLSIGGHQFLLIAICGCPNCHFETCSGLEWIQVPYKQYQSFKPLVYEETLKLFGVAKVRPIKFTCRYIGALESIKLLSTLSGL